MTKITAPYPIWKTIIRIEVDDKGIIKQSQIINLKWYVEQEVERCMN